MNKYVNVNFPLLGKSIDMDENSKISDACAMIGHPLNLVCGGKGKCKKCAVIVKTKDLVSTVVACQTKVFDNINIMITREKVEEHILTTNMFKDIKPDPALFVVHVDQNELNTPICENDFDTIVEVLQLNLDTPSLRILQKLSNTYHHPNGMNIIIYDTEILDILPGDLEKPLLGMAYDIGSTSVVGYLYDLNTHEQIGVSSLLNKQTRIGGDVISRIEYTMTNTNGLATLHDLIIETVNEIIDHICTEHNIDKNNIYQASFCGNSTMQHLFLGLNPTYLGLAPFTSTTHREVSTKAYDLGIKINPHGCINFLPLLGGFVGSDTTAVLLSLENDHKNRLIIDLGTNGEIAVGKNYSFKVSSCACGPALEGAGLESGMRGIKGAIEKVEILNGDLDYKVIGQVKPMGICGSGIIDIVSELFRYNLINKRGAFAHPSEVVEPKLAKRITTTDNGIAFIIAYGEDTENNKPILMTQKDIREVQLAKAAIYTGCLMLIAECGLNGEDLDEILIAGAFGNFIDITNAQSIGMIPYFKNVPVLSIGNAAATGCQMFLLSKEEQSICRKLAQNAEHVEIATNPTFTSKFMLSAYLTKLKLD